MNLEGKKKIEFHRELLAGQLASADDDLTAGK